MLDSINTLSFGGINVIALRMTLALLVVGQSVGCRHHAVEVAPSVWVLDVKVIQQTVDGAQLAINVVVDNPNLVAVPLVRSDYTLLVDGVGSFTSAERLNRTIPAGIEAYGSPVGRQSISLPAAVAGNNTPLAGKTFKVYGTIYYRQGHSFLALRTDSKMRLHHVSFEGTGRVTSPPQ